MRRLLLQLALLFVLGLAKGAKPTIDAPHWCRTGAGLSGGGISWLRRFAKILLDLLRHSLGSGGGCRKLRSRLSVRGRAAIRGLVAHIDPFILLTFSSCFYTCHITFNTSNQIRTDRQTPSRIIGNSSWRGKGPVDGGACHGGACHRRVHMVTHTCRRAVCCTGRRKRHTLLTAMERAYVAECYGAAGQQACPLVRCIVGAFHAVHLARTHVIDRATLRGPGPADLARPQPPPGRPAGPRVILAPTPHTARDRCRRPCQDPASAAAAAAHDPRAAAAGAGTAAATSCSASVTMRAVASTRWGYACTDAWAAAAAAAGVRAKKGRGGGEWKGIMTSAFWSRA